MRLIFAVVAAVLACAGSASAACQMQLVAELPVTLYGSTPVVEAEVNGHKIHMLVDTGSVATLIDRSAVKELGLEPHHVVGVTSLRLYGVGGGGEVDEAMVKEFKLGRAVARNQSMAITGVGTSSDGPDIQGTLGWGFFSQADVEFDFADKVIRLIQPKGCGGAQVVYWNKPYSVAPMAPSNSDLSLRVEVKIDGRPVVAEIDTGSFASTVDEGIAKSLGVVVGSPGAQKGELVGGMGMRLVQTSIATFATFSFGDDETIRNAKLRFANLFVDDRETPAGSMISQKMDLDFAGMLLGADFVRAHRMYVAFSQRKVYVSYNGGPIFNISPSSDSGGKGPPAAAAPAPPASKP